jgi:hypothetical protein
MAKRLGVDKHKLALCGVLATIAWITFAWIAIADSADKKSNQLRTAEIARKVLTEDILKKIKEIK